MNTPGPWKIRSFDLMQRIETNDGNTVAIPAMNDGVSALTCSANARLIAAAPDLLAALQLIHANAAESPEWIRARIDSAIARATSKD